MEKVLILANSSKGVYRFRNELVLRLLKQYEVIISVPDEVCTEELRNEGCKVIFTPINRRGMNPIEDIKLFRFYCKLLKEIRPNIVLTYTIKPNIYGGYACKVNKVPCIVNITGLGSALENGKIMQKIVLCMYKVGLHKVKCVFFQNKYNMDFFDKHHITKAKKRLIPGSGVNLDAHTFEAYPSEEKGITFLALIRVMKEKGIEEFLAMAEVISEKYSNVSFAIAGDYEKETRDIYEPRMKILEEKGSLKYYGYIHNVHELMAKSHILVHPSYHEGLSNVLLEAAACGRPVLASDVPGCRETLVPDISGITFEARNTDSLIQAVEKILSRTSCERAEMGVQGRKYVEENFDRNIVVDAYLEEIQKII